MTNNFIPVYQPTLAGNEKLYLSERQDTTWISSKVKFVCRFEAEFAKYLAVTFC